MNKKPFTPTTHIFLWDLHEVILEKNMRHWFLLCITFNRKWALIRNLNKKSINIMMTFLLERLKIIKKQMVSEELIHAARQTNNQALIELITQICSAYVPIQKTVELMQELSQQGYKHHLGSNIGKTVYDNCTAKFPTIFSLFQGSTIAFNETEEKMIKKPHPDFFTTHIQKYNLQPENVIFIDDKLVNVQAAQSVGLHGIHFKNPAQLRDKLIFYKIIKK
jgi:FMN phosphatase YigB (HAD superfamily)